MSNPWNLQLTMVGTNHKHAPIETRERLWCPPDTLPGRLKALVQGEIEEAVALSTCNRTEIYTISASSAQTTTEVKQALSKWSRIDQAEIQQCVYTLTGEEAARHLIAVASGLNSLAIGEQQIQEQVKQALRVANRAGTGGRFLSELFRHADNAATNIRERSGLKTERISVSSAVTLMLRKLSTEQKIRTILLVGAGKMISLAAEDLGVLSGIEVLVANRTVRKAEDLANRVRGRAIGLGDIPEALEKADVVLTCTSSDEYVIGAEELQKAVQRRLGNPLVVIDVAVPRNVNPEAKLIAGLTVYDIDDLAPFGEEGRKGLQPKLDEAERLVDEETRAFYAHLRGYETNDLLKDLMKVAEGIREEELSRALRKLGDVPSREKTILELLTRRIVNKLLYEPTLRLKAHATNGDGPDYETVIRELFDIGRHNDQ
jgi:glutamyl-tRNA reductase